ncbi:MAG: TfuA-like protein [Pseudomonadota bacterium]
MTDASLVIFTGPSLGPGDASALIDADIRPPAAQGDIFAAALEAKPKAIGLIDGVFQSEPAVRHKEILWAIGQGITVFGAASMGALRAAELHGFGMIGVGLIYRWYRMTPLAADDAVAVLHGPTALGAAAMSDGLINLRLTFKHCRRRGMFDRETERALIDIANRLPYRQRTRATILEVAHAEGISPLPDLAAIDKHWRDQKRLDAEALVKLMAACQASDRWPQSQPPDGQEITDAWANDLIDAGFSLDAVTGAL